MTDEQMQAAQSVKAGFGPFASTRLALGLGVAWLSVLAFFYLLPEIDIALAGLFYDSVACAQGQPCASFPMNDNPVLRQLREILQIIPVGIGVLTLIVLIIRRIRNVTETSTATYRAPLAAVLALLIGPLLLVNLIIKANSGRPRPLQSDVFSGPWEFVPAGDFSGACPTNCSFVSGEGSIAFWLFCLVPMIPDRFRKIAWISIGLMGTFMATMRIGFGAHFPSDVILGALITPLVYCLLAIAFTRRERRILVAGGQT